MYRSQTASCLLYATACPPTSQKRPGPPHSHSVLKPPWAASPPRLPEPRRCLGQTARTQEVARRHPSLPPPVPPLPPPAARRSSCPACRRRARTSHSLRWRRAPASGAEQAGCVGRQDVETSGQSRRGSRTRWSPWHPREESGGGEVEERGRGGGWGTGGGLGLGSPARQRASTAPASAPGSGGGSSAAAR